MKNNYAEAGIKFSANSLVKQNIEELKNDQSFTVTTGHQLCLFLGPLYFIYKIVSTIKLSESLKEKYPEYNFIPAYWMASEDHDFDEINHFYFKGKKIAWNSGQEGAVGRMRLDNMKKVFEAFSRSIA